MKKDLIKHIFRKKNIIFVIALILVASIAATFFVSCGDGGDPVGPLDNQDSKMLKTPTDDSTPIDYDANNNAYYALYAMNQLQSFTAQSFGETVSKVAFANVSQKIKGNRVVSNGEIYKENVSHSKFRSVGVRTFIKGDNYIVHNADKVSSVDNVVWEADATRVSKESYLNKFGYVPNSITSYILNDETILSSQYLGEENGIYSFYYELDPVKSTGRLCLEMRTMAGNDSLPEFETAAITVRMNKNWQVTEVVTASVYKVAMLGGITCTESVVEQFANFNQEVIIPNAEFYHSYVDAEITEPAPVTMTATDYLMEGFADYITGAKPIKLSATVSSDYLSATLDAVVNLNAEDMSLTGVSVALKNLAYQDINLNNIVVYYEDSKIYLNAAGFKAVTDIDELSATADQISQLFGIDLLASFKNLDLATFDVDSLLDNATLVEQENTATVTIPLALGDSAINAQIVFNKGEQITVNNVVAQIGDVAVEIVLNNDIVMEERGEGYYAITPLLQILDENISLQMDIGNITAIVNINLTTFEIDVFVPDLTVGECALGDVVAKVVDGTVYANALGLKVKLALADIPTILDKLAFANIELPDFDVLKNVDATAVVKEILNSLSMSDTQDGITVGATALGYDFDISLAVEDGGYSLSEITTSVEGNNVKVTLFSGDVNSIDSADLNNYSDVSTLFDIIVDNQINLSVKAFDLDIDVNINLADGTALAKTTLFDQTLYAKFANQTVYVSYKGLNGYVQLADLDKVLDKLGIFVGEIILPDFSAITIKDVIDSLTVVDADVVTAGLSVCGIDVSVVLDKTNGLQVSSITATVGQTTITAAPSQKANFDGFTATQYYNLASLLDIIDESGKISVTVQAFDTTIYATIDLPNNQILVALDQFEILVDLNENVAYVRYPGVSLKLNLDEIDVVLRELEPIITRFITQEEFDSIKLDAFDNINVEDVISSLVVTESDDALNVSLSLATLNANVTVDKVESNLIVSGGTITIGSVEAVFSTSATPLDFTFDKTETYIGVTELVQTFAPALKNILTLDNLYASMTATVVSGNQIFELTECEVLITNVYTAPKARVSLTVKITTNNADGTTSVSEHKITLIYLDPTLVGEGEINTYFTYDDTSNADVFEGTFTTVNFYETLNIVKQIYANMPELQTTLKPFIVADENSMPKFMDINVDFAKLINSAFFAEGVLSVDANGKAVLSDLSSTVWINLFSQDGLLCLDIDDLAFDNTVLSLNARVGEAPSGVITDDKFVFTPSSSASDFSSINEMLHALEKTSQERHFFIDAKIDLTGTGLLSLLKVTDKINVKIYLDVIDGKTYFKAEVKRDNVNLVVMDVWSDYDGTSYVYFDPDTQIIYVHNHYRTKGGSWLRPTYTEHDEYIKYTADQFAQDPLTAIFDILHISSDLKDIINSETSKETKVSTATIDNTFKSYSYNGADTFNITLDLAPLTTDINTVSVAIKHDSEFNLVGLNATANMMSILDLKLTASLTTSNVSYGTDVELKAIANNSNFN